MRGSWPNRPGIGIAALLTLALLAAGCGSSSEGEFDGSHPNYEQDLKGSPPPLAALYAQGNELLDGGQDAFEKRLAELRGYPVVVNLWASWCGPCKFEFPAFQQLSAEYGKKVAFLGVNSEDSDGFAERFLQQAPVPYPSYTDPDADIKDDLGAGGFPDTAFYKRNGELCFFKQGQFADNSEIREAVKQFALAERGCEGA
jgi:cytochrome c biogenesis protein CcmG/thiol:disulfide interchange protein DsbE